MSAASPRGTSVGSADRKGRSSGPCSTCRPSNWKAVRRTAAATSSRSARSCMKWPRARRCFPAAAASPWRRRCFTTIRRQSRRCNRPARWRSIVSFAHALRKILSSAGRTRTTSHCNSPPSAKVDRRREHPSRRSVRASHARNGCLGPSRPLRSLRQPAAGCGSGRAGYRPSTTVRFLIPACRWGNEGHGRGPSVSRLSPDGSQLAMWRPTRPEAAGASGCVRFPPWMPARSPAPRKRRLVFLGRPTADRSRFLAGGKLKRLELAGWGGRDVERRSRGDGRHGHLGRRPDSLRVGDRPGDLPRADGRGAVRSDQTGPIARRVSHPMAVVSSRRPALPVSRAKCRSCWLADDRGTRQAAAPGDAGHFECPQVDPGYIVFARDGTLVGQRFDVSTGQVTGDPIAIGEPLRFFFRPESRPSRHPAAA